MGIPEVIAEIDDKASGIGDTNALATIALIGYSTGGTANAVTAYNDPDSLIADQVSGPLAEQGAAASSELGSGTTILVVPATASTAGSTPALTHGGTGTAMVTMSVGAAKDAYRLLVAIALGGTVGTATFTYSLDGGATVVGPIVTAATYAIPGSGLTLAFAAGTYILNDTWAAQCIAPMMTLSDIQTAFAVLLADKRAWKLCHVIGSAAGTLDSDRQTAAVALATGLDVLIQSAFTTAHRSARVIVDGAPPVDDSSSGGLAAYEAACQTGWAAFNSAVGRVSVYSDPVDIVSQITLRTDKRPLAWVAVWLAGKLPISVDLSATETGAFPGRVKKLYRDERNRPNLDAYRFGTARTWVGTSGLFLTNPNTMAPVGSDYALLQFGLIIDAAVNAAYPVMVRSISKRTRAYPAGTVIGGIDMSGKIDDRDAKVKEDAVKEAIGGVLLPDHVPNGADSIAVKVNRADIIKTTKKVRWKLTLEGFVYPKSGSLTASFATPLAAAAA